MKNVLSRWLVLPGLLALACDRPNVIDVAPELVFSSARLDFGAPLIGTTVTRTVELKNQGAGDLIPQISTRSCSAQASLTQF